MVVLGGLSGGLHLSPPLVQHVFRISVWFGATVEYQVQRRLEFDAGVEVGCHGAVRWVAAVLRVYD